MDRVFIVSGIVRGYSVNYGYYKTESSALAGLEKQAESFRSKGFTVEHLEAIRQFNEHAEILLYDGPECEYYGHIRVHSQPLND